MNLPDIPMLLGFASFFDMRLSVDELRARAWFEALDHDLELEEAKKIVSGWYGNHDGVISPAHINKEWRLRKSAQADRERSARLSAEFEASKAHKASPEVVAKYMAEIRRTLRRDDDASLENHNGEVASDL
jgi:hypothetical protein